jgi:amino acid adenylation domain-containing protein
MTIISQKIINDYWDCKTKQQSIKRKQSITPKASEHIHIKEDDLQYLYKLTAENYHADFTILLTLYNILLQRYAFKTNFILSLIEGQKEVLFHVPAIQNQSIKEYLALIKTEVQEVYSYSDYTPNILKQTNFSDYTNFGFSYRKEIEEEEDAFVAPFHLLISKEQKGLNLTIYFREEFVERDIITHFISRFKYQLINLKEGLQQKAEEFDIITSSERKKLLEEFNSTEAAYPDKQTIVELFEDQVENTPNAQAIVTREKSWSYQELNEISNQLAYYLRIHYKVSPNDLVGILLPRSEWMLVAVYGVLKSGAAYVPIDPNYPTHRIETIQKDASLKVIIDEKELASFMGNVSDYPTGNLPRVNSPKDLVYVIYTSGSTGVPKGVMIEHNALINRLHWMQKVYSLNTHDRILQKTTYTFDVSVWELLWWGLYGSSIYLLEVDGEKNPSKILDAVATGNVSVLHFVPSMLSVFLDYVKVNPSEVNRLASLRQVFTSGEVLGTHHIESFRNLLPAVSLMNLYGPTETSIDVSYYDCTNGSIGNSVPIGKPIDNTQLMVLDSKGHLVPVGVEGELYISGVGLSRGYLNREELTNSRFLPNPYHPKSSMYATGDIARWQADGNLLFIGRKDDQVKLRGFRIELGEITHTILSKGEVKDTVVLVREVEGEQVLVAYIVMSTNRLLDRNKLRNWLLSCLPDYMVPSYYITLSKFPLTPNGKLNRNQLPLPDENALSRNTYISPKTAIEKNLAKIWQVLLGIEKIGVTDNFFELGGHSLKIHQLINLIHKELGYTLKTKDVFENPRIIDIINCFKHSAYTDIPQITKSVYYPISAAQQRLWLLNHSNNTNGAYNISGTYKLKGNLDITKLEETFQVILQRHESMRTCFGENENGVLSQFVIPSEKVNFNIQLEDLRKSDTSEKALHQSIKTAYHTKFDLEKSPLFKVKLLQLNDQTYFLTVVIHHIISDGQSLKILLEEFQIIYNNLLEGHTITLPELSIQYKDYTSWKLSEKQLHKENQQEDYWLSKFKEETPALKLPTNHLNSSEHQEEEGVIYHQFSNTFSEHLQCFSKQQEVTIFMLFMASIKALLYRYTSINDIVIGTPVSERNHIDLEQQIGLYLNTLAIRTLIDGNTSYEKLLTKQKEILLEAYANQDYPYNRLAEHLKIPKDKSLFNIMIAMQKEYILDDDKLIDLTLTPYLNVPRGESQFDLTFYITEKTDGLKLVLEYNTELYNKQILSRFVAHLHQLMTEGMKTPTLLIDDISFILPSERKILLEEFNHTAAIYPYDQTIVELFEAQVKQNPSATAIVTTEKILSYEELNVLSNQFAHFLRSQYDIKPNELVGILLPRSTEMLIAIYGVLKSGGAYVPIDPNYPEHRIETIQSDASLRAIIDTNEFAFFTKHLSKYSSNNPKKVNNTNDLAYVIYTSGSTGKPKGVMIEHSALINRLNWMQKAYALKESDRILQKTTYTFDVSVWELLWWGFYGSSVYLLEVDGEKNPSKIVDAIATGNVSVIHFVPSMLSVFLEHLEVNPSETARLDSLSQVFISGESLGTHHITRFRKLLPKVSLMNLYGPTEASIDVSYYNCTHGAIGNSVPIGKPIDNTQLMVLDKKGKLVPIGLEGELFISGVGLSRGYLNREELTHSSFLANPYYPNSKMYATGDIASWQSDGNLLFMGRKDDQIKLRGFRIELGEITHAILNEGQAKDAAVIVRDVEDKQAIVAYIVMIDGKNLDIRKLRKWLLSHLPDYMIPSYYMGLPTLPLTTNGKLARKILPNPTSSDLPRSTYLAPKTVTEKELVKIWQEVLNLEKVGITDDFFELGGNSLHLVKVLNKINTFFQIRILLDQLYKTKNIQSLCEIVDFVISQNRTFDDESTEEIVL